MPGSRDRFVGNNVMPAKNNQAQAGRQIEALLYHGAVMRSTNTTPAVANYCQEAGASSWIAANRQPGRAQSTFRQADALAVTDSPYHACSQEPAYFSVRRGLSNLAAFVLHGKLSHDTTGRISPPGAGIKIK